MCKINLSYKGAYILKTALENQIKAKDEIVKSQGITDENFIMAL